MLLTRLAAQKVAEHVGVLGASDHDIERVANAIEDDLVALDSASPAVGLLAAI